MPDRTRPLDFEVYRRDAVEGYRRQRQRAAATFLPFYAANDLTPTPGTPRLLHAAPRAAAAVGTRQQRGPRSSYVGSEVFISLVDAERGAVRADAAPARRSTAVHQPRSAAADAGGQAAHRLLTLDVERAGAHRCRCLVGPSAPRARRSDGESPGA